MAYTAYTHHMITIRTRQQMPPACAPPLHSPASLLLKIQRGWGQLVIPPCLLQYFLKQAGVWGHRPQRFVNFFVCCCHPVGMFLCFLRKVG